MGGWKGRRRYGGKGKEKRTEGVARRPQYSLTRRSVDLCVYVLVAGGGSKGSFSLVADKVQVAGLSVGSWPTYTLAPLPKS